MLNESHALQYKALTDQAGVYSLRDWTTLEVTGDDRASFLHNMCTNDVRSLKVGDGCEAFITDVKGKIVGHVFVLAMIDALYLLTVPNQSERLTAHLDRYIIREDVQLEESAGALSWTLLAGKESAAVLSRVGQGDLPTASLQHVEADVNGITTSLVNFPAVWPGGYLLACATDQESELHALLQSQGAVACEQAAFNALRVESAWPMYGVDFDETNLPQEVSRNDQAIHFNKGCYLGQETIARIDALGHVNQQLATIKLDSEETPPSGSEVILEDKPAGRVTSSCWSPREQAPLALAMLRRAALQAGADLTCDRATASVLSHL